MKYTGRIITTIFAIISYLVMCSIGHPPLNHLHIIFLILFSTISCWLGKQYDTAKFYSEKDALTKVYNRRFVQTNVPKLLASAKENNQKIGFFVVDVDNFKIINDTYGHDIGDKVLKAISDAIVLATKEIGTVARWGGDELIIITPLKNKEYSEAFISTVEKELKIISQTLDVSVSVSIGSSLFPDDGSDLDELINDADKKMFQFKLLKKNITQFEPKLFEIKDIHNFQLSSETIDNFSLD